MKKNNLALWQSALIGGVVAICVNLVFLQFAKPLAPDFMSLSAVPVIFWTAIASIGATVVFAIIRKYAQNPNPLFIRVSVGALVLSFGMDIPLFFFDVPFFAGATTGGVVSLMAMHVIVATIIVPILVKFTR